MLRNPRSEVGEQMHKKKPRHQDATGGTHRALRRPARVCSPAQNCALSGWPCRPRPRVLGSGQTQSFGPTDLSADHGSVSSLRPTSPPLPVPCLPSLWRGPSISNPSACQNYSLLACPGRPPLCSYPGQPQKLGHLHLGSWQLRLSPALSCSSWCGPGAVAPWELVLEKQEFGHCRRQTG